MLSPKSTQDGDDFKKPTVNKALKEALSTGFCETAQLHASPTKSVYIVSESASPTVVLAVPSPGGTSEQTTRLVVTTARTTSTVVVAVTWSTTNNTEIGAAASAQVTHKKSLRKQNIQNF